MAQVVRSRYPFDASQPLVMGVGIEDTFVPQGKPGFRPLDEYELTGHYDHWRVDLDVAGSTGARWIRYGLPWYRLNPAPGVYDFGWADEVVDHILELGFEVVVDVIHYGTPTWLEGEFDHPDYPAIAGEYAARLAARYGDRISMWSPLNEPYATALQCGMRGVWPPYLTGEPGYMRVLEQAMKGAVRTQQAIAAEVPDALFVHCEAALNYELGDERVRDEYEYLRERRFLPLDLFTGAVDASSPSAEAFVARGLDGRAFDWFAENACRIDLLGVNYYPTFGTLVLTEESGTVRESPLDRWTDGFARVLRDYHERFGVPLYISETSLEGPLDERLRWLRDSVALAHRLRDEGMPLVGYTWWPILDMIGWDYRHTTLPVTEHIATMGLSDLVAGPGGRFARRPNALLDAYREVVAAQ